MATGRYPFNEHGTALQLFEEIARTSVTVPAFVSDSLNSLIRGMLDPNPVTRFALEQVLQHPWVTAQEECLDPVGISPLRTIFTEESIKRFLRETYTGSRYALVSGDQIDGDGFADAEPDVIDPTLRVNRRPLWCSSWCSIL